MKKNSKGFTLIELLVVIAIIALLSSIILSSLNSARQRARDAERVSDVSQLRIGLQLFYSDYQFYPTTLDQLTSGVAYVNKIPKDPLSNSNGGLAQYLPSGISQAATTYLGSHPTDPLSNGGTFQCRPEYCYGYYIAPGETTPSRYHIGTQLETSSPVLETDEDCTSDSGSETYSCVSGLVFTDGFSGNGASYPGSADYIFDVQG